MKDFLLENSNLILLALAILPHAVALAPTSLRESKYTKFLMKVLDYAAANYLSAQNKLSVQKKTAADLMRK